MSGLVKAKEHKLEDSNVEMLGSDLDRDVKKKAAETEEAWKGCGQKPGLQIWRIVNFQVVHWPKDQYGEFYKGDSYIILRTYKEPDSEELCYDLHFWLGEDSTQDEMGTAAYKTVELDTLLDDKPVQYREVERSESAKFKKCFEDITYLEGGAESGFRHVKDEIPPPKVYELCGCKEDNICINEIKKPDWKYLHIHNVFIFVVNRSIIRYYGSKCNKFEKWRATIYVGKLKSRVHKFDSTDIILGDDDITKMIETFRKENSQSDENVQELQGEYEQQEDSDELSEEDKQSRAVFDLLREALHGDPPEDFDIKTNEVTFDKKREVPLEDDFKRKLIRMTKNKNTTRLEIEVVAEEDEISEDMIDEEHVFILDNGKEVSCFAGKKVGKKEKNNQMVHCCTYLKDKVNKNAPVSMVKDSQKFKQLLRKR